MNVCLSKAKSRAVAYLQLSLLRVTFSVFNNLSVDKWRIL